VHKIYKLVEFRSQQLLYGATQLRVMLFVHSKVDNFWGQPSFLYRKKKVRGGERENKNIMRVCERELSIF
jgi:hypothetical protein